MKVAAVIPAHNEERRIVRVIETLKSAKGIDEIIVVSDGSTDKTYETAAGIDGIKAVKLARNLGKGGAMSAGAKHTNAEILLFMDADLIGLTPSHAEDLLRPILEEQADMSIGVFRGGRMRTDWAQMLTPFISGQRAIRKELFLSVPNAEQTRYGIEIAISRHVRSSGLNTVLVPLAGVTHPMKEEKLGYLMGTISRAKMYWEIVKMVMLTSVRRTG